MTVKTGTVAMDDRLQQSAYSALAVLKRNLDHRGYKLTPENESESIIKALAWHDGHVLLIGIRQDQLDPFKFTCWLGGTLIEKIEKNALFHDVIFDGVIDTLEEIMFEETHGNVFLLDQDRELLKRMLVAEQSGNCEYGIGFNGLYMAFHFACATVKNLVSRGLIRVAPTAVAAKSSTADKAYPEG